MEMGGFTIASADVKTISLPENGLSVSRVCRRIAGARGRGRPQLLWKPIQLAARTGQHRSGAVPSILRHQAEGAQVLWLQAACTLSQNVCSLWVKASRAF